jgi:hypothetical protein
LKVSSVTTFVLGITRNEVLRRESHWVSGNGEGLSFRVDTETIGEGFGSGKSPTRTALFLVSNIVNAHGSLFAPVERGRNSVGRNLGFVVGNTGDERTRVAISAEKISSVPKSLALEKDVTTGDPSRRRI